MNSTRQHQARKKVLRPAPKRNGSFKTERRPGGKRPFQKKRPEHIEEKPFDDFLKAASKGIFDEYSVEPFGKMEYADELRIKNNAFAAFWKHYRLPCRPEPIVPAVKPRHYRANSKRKCVFSHGVFKMFHPVQREIVGTTLAASELEPEIHAAVYRMARAEFSRQPARYLATHLNYCIVRGVEECSVILNVNRMDSEIVRLAKHFSDRLRKDIPGVISAFLYLDETRSDYYLETKRPARGPGIRKLFGPDTLSIPVSEGKRLLYPPTAFSQVNESMLPEFLEQCRILLSPGEKSSLLDLYCGYGLIGLALADHFSAILGVEIDGPAVEAAARNAEFLYPRKKAVFIPEEISDKVIRNLPDAVNDERIVLDPPRSGTSNKVIREIAKRKAETVLHIFCGTDVIPDAIRQWSEAGYTPVAVHPVDMFPGTGGIETMIKLEKIKK